MTFLEAAVVVLRREAKPLHFREITRQAIALDLLSHIGKAPEQAMQTRLAAAARRSQDPEVIRKGPGIYSAAKLGRARVSVEAEGHSKPKERKTAKPTHVPEKKAAQNTQQVQNPSPRAKRRRNRRRKSNGVTSGDLVSGIEKLIESRSRPIVISELATAVRSRGYVTRDVRREELVIETILVAVNAVAIASGQRPRFVVNEAKVDLFEKSVDSEVLQMERRIEVEQARLKQHAHRRVSTHIEALPIGALAVIVKACLCEPPRSGANLVTVVNAREARLIAPRPQPERGYDAVVVLRDPENQSSIAKRAIELRRSLRELNARAGILVVPCMVLDSTRDQAGISGDPVIELWGLDDLAHRMERLGLGFREVGPSRDPFDAEFFERLTPRGEG